tara:strand:- start:1388 stop:2077 length:690 start_codon:yes stop_codon:yes gene_type:complete
MKIDKMKDLANQLILLVKKDLILEWRTKEFTTASLVLGMLIVVVLNFGIRLTSEQWEMAGPGVLWICFVLSGIVGVGRAFQSDFDNEALTGIDLLGISRDILFFSKMTTCMIFIMMMLLVLIVPFIALLGFNPFSWELLVVLILFSLGFSLVSTLFVFVSNQTKSKDVIMYVLILPVVLPILIASIEVTRELVAGYPLNVTNHWLGILVGFDLVYLVICPWLFGIILDD